MLSNREIKVCGLIKDLRVQLVVYLDISVLMNVVVIDVPNAWGMLLSRKWSSSLGGNLHMDLFCATIPTCENSFSILHKERLKKIHVEDEDPQDPMNGPCYVEEELENYAILSNSLEPIKEEIK